MAIQAVSSPKADVPLIDAGGNAVTFWFQLWNSFTVAINSLIKGSVQGASTLTHPGQIAKVTSAGTIGESRYAEGELLALKYSLQADLAALAATLSAADAGLLVNVTDYAHILRWTGTAWEWGPGESGSGMLQPFAVSPTGNGWHPCDGTTGVKYLKSDGTTDNVDLPDTHGTAAYMKLAAGYVKTISAAVAPTVTAPTFTGTPGVTAASAGTQGSGATVNTLTQATHTHSFTPAGTVSAPTASLAGGDPVAHFAAVLYFRQ